jgi:hypothetical protein
LQSSLSAVTGIYFVAVGGLLLFVSRAVARQRGTKIFFGTARIVIWAGDYPGERVAAAHPALVAQTLPTWYMDAQINQLVRFNFLISTRSLVSFFLMY